MRKSAKKALVLVVGVIVALILFAGCEEENRSDTKSSITRSRFIANENRQLKEQLVRRDRKIESLRNQLQECQKEKKYLEQDAQKDMADMIGLSYNILTEKSDKVKEENKKLKLEIKELKKQLKAKE